MPKSFMVILADCRAILAQLFLFFGTYVIDLYLIRHGIAEVVGEDLSDEKRVLSAEGRQKTKIVARRLYALEVRFDTLLTSPLVRTRQTAEILVQERLATKCEAFEPLAPSGSIGALRDWLATQRSGAIGLVGHQPCLGLWAEALIWGTAHNGFDIKKAGVVRLALETPQSFAQLIWFLPPKVLL
jgi:phosphohistidine phosphatase